MKKMMAAGNGGCPAERETERERGRERERERENIVRYGEEVNGCCKLWLSR